MEYNRRTRLASLGSRARVAVTTRTAKGKEAPAADVSLVAALCSLDGQMDEDRATEENHHASALLTGCPRAQALMRLGLVTGRRQISSADRLLWAIGRAVEHHIRSTLIQFLGMARVYGKWSCLCQREMFTGFGDKEKGCTRCNHTVSIYGEVDLADEELGITGHPDFMYLVGKKLRVAEIKSKKKELFELLQAAEPGHIYQASLYRQMAQATIALESGMQIDETVVVLYGAKDYPRPGAKVYKEFTYPVSLPQVKTAIDLAYANAHSINKAKSTSTLPSRLGGCASTSSPMAKGCAACAACFALKA